MSDWIKNPFVEKIILCVIALVMAGVASMGTSFVLFRYQIPDMRSDITKLTTRVEVVEKAINDVGSHTENTDNLLQTITKQLDELNGGQDRLNGSQNELVLLANTTATRQEGLIQDIDELKEEVKEMRRRGTTP